MDRIGPHTDVYGLGATLYHAVTGKAPVSGNSAWEVLHNVSTQDAVPPNVINPDVSEDLSFVIMKALDKQADRRYEDMQMFSEDLGHILEGRPPLARLHARSVTRHGSRISFFQRIASSLSTLMPTRRPSACDPHATLALEPKEPCEAREGADNSGSNGESSPTTAR